MDRTLFPTTLSIPSYDIGKKVGLRTYQYLLLVHRIIMLYFLTRNRKIYVQTVPLWLQKSNMF